MDNTQRMSEQQGNTSDRPVEQLMLIDPEVQTLYQHGHIGRPLAEIFDIITDFNDEQGGAVCGRG